MSESAQELVDRMVRSWENRLTPESFGFDRAYWVEAIRLRDVERDATIALVQVKHDLVLAKADATIARLRELASRVVFQRTPKLQREAIGDLIHYLVDTEAALAEQPSASEVERFTSNDITLHGYPNPAMAASPPSIPNGLLPPMDSRIVDVTCMRCGRIFQAPKYRKFCSRDCYHGRAHQVSDVERVALAEPGES